MLKRNGSPMLQAASAKCHCHDIEATVERPSDQVSLDEEPDTSQLPSKAQYFCKRCIKLDLATLLTRESNATRIGFLKAFNDPTRSVNLNGRHPSVHMQSKRWGYFDDLSGNRKAVYRIILALDQRPQNVRLMRQAMPYDKKAKFVLTELEVDPMKIDGSIVVTSYRRPIPSRIDLALVQRFRLIDVIEGRLVDKTEPCEYIALSYVWGQAASFGLCTNNENLSTLYQPSSLDKSHTQHRVSKRLPKTIADANSLCRFIGQRYLWVDSLCIVQDDPDEKRRLIHGMNSVYENADLTLVALSGVDADAGLAGITPRASARLGAPWYGRNRNRDPLDFVQPDNSLDVMYQCRGASDPQWLDTEFQKIVSVYTRRNLKEPGDILHALTGVYNKFYSSSDGNGLGISELQGIPMRCFARALLCLVEEWCLIFQTEKVVTKQRFSGRIFDDKNPTSPVTYEMNALQLLKMFPRIEHSVPDVILPPLIPGLLDFLGLYIPAPKAAACPVWSKGLGRQWHLNFEGTTPSQSDLEGFAIALFDCEETMDAFVLLLYDGTYLGICVKKAGDYFKRVGICMMTNSRKDWETVTQKGLLEIYWKRIMLR
ncbi:HET-domain-containing protein [Diaporthe eres]|nr:HET-domain-containing protein [Diaporthe eres]